jgi:Uma2 family endonuclease
VNVIGGPVSVVLGMLESVTNQTEEHIMRVLAVEPEQQQRTGWWDELVRFWEETDWPEGSRAEIIEGIVTVAPPPTGKHNVTASKVIRAIHPALPDDVEPLCMQGLQLPGREGIYIPDLVVLPTAAAVGTRSDATEALLVVEITSPSTARQDRVTKLRGYAQASIPLYLLLDPVRKDPAATLHADPEDGAYRTVTTVPYGEKLHLPAPFDVVLDTAAFPVP